MNIISKSILSIAAILAVAATSQAAGVSQFKDVDKYLGSKRYASAPKAFTYMNDGSNYLQLTQDGKKIIKYATGNGKEIDLLLDLDNTREGNIDKISGFKMSPQENKILVWKNSKSTAAHLMPNTMYMISELAFSALCQPIIRDNRLRYFRLTAE